MPGSAIVIGAGTFGASLARNLVREDWTVTLIDQAEPGHERAASGGESRLIRCSHGSDAWYTASVRRARTLWLELEEETGLKLLEESGVAWFARRPRGWESDSERTLRDLRIPVERLDLGAARRLFPSLNTDDLRFVLYEPEAGALRAAVATKALADSAVASGAQFIRGLAQPDGDRVAVDGRTLEADVVVWACGPWLGALFGDLVSLRVTRQDLFLFDAGPDWRMPPTPGWVDYDGAAYGVGDLDGEGFKVASDVEGPPSHPDTREMVPPPDAEPRARAYLAHRFPALAQAAVTKAVTCSYALTADTHFIAAPHPEHPRVWLLGGGSGHGFKHGPSMAEYVTEMLSGVRPLDTRFALGERQVAGSLRTAGMAPTASRDEALIRSFVDTWDTQGLEAALQLATEDVEWHSPPEFPEKQELIGREAIVTAWGQQFGAVFDDLRLAVLEVVAATDGRWIAGSMLRARSSNSGVSLDQAAYAVVRLEGDLLAEIAIFFNRDQALAAAGLSS
jgi:sarcosine oxidase